MLAGILLTFARSLGEFGATLMVAGSIPGKTETIPIAIYFAAESGAMDQALWLVLIMLSISLGVITGVNYWLENKQNRFLSHAERCEPAEFLSLKARRRRPAKERAPSRDAERLRDYFLIATVSFLFLASLVNIRSNRRKLS